jgi:sensor domain CHASE-containing protein
MGGPAPFPLVIGVVLLVIQLLVLKELLKRNLENKLTNHIVAAANLSPMILGALMLGSGILACSC